MNSTDYYRKRAGYCRIAAEETGDPELRRQFETFASDYDELARASQGSPTTGQATGHNAGRPPEHRDLGNRPAVIETKSSRR
jgi:hypothetical protein